MIGKELSNILEEVETSIWELEALEIGPLYFTMGGFRAANKIFISTLLERMWLHTQELSQKEKEELAAKAGEEIKDLVKRYTGINTEELYFH